MPTTCPSRAERAGRSRDAQFLQGGGTEFQEFLAETPELAERARPKVVLECGQPETVLSEYSFNHRSDLVVTGTHGRTGILRTAIGSVAERLLESLPSDVLIVRLAAGE